MNAVMRDLSKLTREVRFHEKFRGYAYEEVDAYVSSVSAAAAKLQQHLSHLENKVSELQRRLNEAESQLASAVKTPQNPESDESVVSEKLAGVLILAQRVTDQLKSEAETEAQEMLASAYQEAEKIKNDADMAVGMQIQEAQTRGAGIVSEAEAQAELLVSQAKRHASEKADAIHVNALVKVRDLERAKTDLANEIKDLEAKLGNQIWQLNVLWKSLSVCAAELGLDTVAEADAERGATSAYRDTASKPPPSASPAASPALNTLNPDIPDFGMQVTSLDIPETSLDIPSSSIYGSEVTHVSGMQATSSNMSSSVDNADNNIDEYAGEYSYGEDYTSSTHGNGYDNSIITNDEVADSQTLDVVYKGNSQQGNGHQGNSHHHQEDAYDYSDVDFSQEFYLEPDVENVHLSIENEQTIDSQSGQDAQDGQNAEHERGLGEGQDEFLDQLRHVVSSNGLHATSKDKKQKDMM